MSISEELGRNLVQLAQRWLKRPLTSEEHEQLRQFQLGLGNDASSDPAVHARQQAERHLVQRSGRVAPQIEADLAALAAILVDMPQPAPQ